MSPIVSYACKRMLKTKISYAVSFWWVRILIFHVLFAIIFFSLDITFNAFISHIINSNIVYELYSYFLFFCAVFFTSVIIEGTRVGSRWYAFGLFPGKFALREIASGAALALASIIFIGLLGIALGYKLSFNFSVPLYFQISFSSFIFLSAAFEELVCRGIIFQAVMERFGAIPAAIIMSGIFSYAHIFNPFSNAFALINVFIAGLLLSAMYIKTYSLWMPISFHFVWNWAQGFLLDSNISGNNFNEHLIKIEFNKAPQWIFGGAFGIEGGLLTTLVLIVMLIIVLKYSNVSPYAASILFKRSYAESELIYNITRKKNDSLPEKESTVQN